MDGVISARLVGGAGTGKTAAALDVLEKAMDRPEVGRNPYALGFSSMTRAARTEAAERAGRAWGMPPGDLMGSGFFKTAHSIAYRAIGAQRGQICDRDVAWLGQALQVDLSYTGDADDDESPVRLYRGQKLADSAAAKALNLWSLARNTIRPLKDVSDAAAEYDNEICTEQVIATIERYEAAKRLEDRMDFSDLLARFVGLSFDPAHGPVDKQPDGTVPDEVVGWIFDEAQDASKLLDLACRRIVTGNSVRWVWLMGDPFQTIFSFSGASASHFMSWPVKVQKVMPRSYRCGAAVLALGERCLQPLPDYWDRGIAPADHESTVEQIDEYADAVAAIDPRRSTLVLARTKWQLAKMTGVMKDTGVPFREVRCLKAGPLNHDLGCAALWKLQRNQLIDREEWRAALDLIPTGGGKAGTQWLRRGAKKGFADTQESAIDKILPTDIAQHGATEALIHAIRSGEWPQLVKDGQQWVNAAERWGVDVMSAPKVRVGTIHATKGQEADDVVLLSSLGERVSRGAADNHEQWCEERRVEYVAVTRARRRLIITHEQRERYRMELPV